MLLPTAVGAVAPSALVPETMADGDLRGGGRVCVVGFRGLKDFFPALVADNLSRGPDGVTARAVELDLRPEGRADPNALAYARAFDDAYFRAEVVSQLVARVDPDELVAFPAGARARLAARGVGRDGAPLRPAVFEIPTLPPSVPGIRVYTTLAQLLTRAGGRVVLNNVITGAERSGDRVRTLPARVGLREVTFAPEWVVLATGGFSAGGLELDSNWVTREVALGLPVAGAPAAGRGALPRRLLRRPADGGVGVRTDREQRPVGEDGGRVVENVLVAGATLAGAEPWREKSGDGSPWPRVRAAELRAPRTTTSRRREREGQGSRQSAQPARPRRARPRR